MLGCFLTRVLQTPGLEAVASKMESEIGMSSKFKVQSMHEYAGYGFSTYVSSLHSP